MKNYLILLISLFSFSYLSASEAEECESSIKGVTVYTSGAQIEREATINFASGTAQIALPGVSPLINPSSIQIAGIGNFTIMDVSYNTRYPEPIKQDPVTLPQNLKTELGTLEDELFELNFDIELITNKKEVLTREKFLIENNPLMTGESARSDTMPVLREAIEFYHAKMNELNIGLVTLRKEEHFQIKKRNKLSTRINEINNWTTKANPNPPSPNAPIHEVLVTINASTSGSGKLICTYMVSKAGWTPSYDIRAKDIESPIELSYKGDVYQQTGVDWNDVKLTVSTGNPNRSNERPILNPWYVNIYNPDALRQGLGFYQSNSKLKNMVYAESDYEDMDEIGTTLNSVDGSFDWKDSPKKEASFVPVSTAVNQLSVSYEVELLHDIPSDGKGHSVRIKDEEVATQYEYHTVPKMEKAAFLLAKVPDWGKLNLLPGEANLFFDDTYIGKSTINPHVMADTLLLSLGRDDAILVKRDKLKSADEEGFFSKTTITTNTIEITLRNNKSSDVLVDVLDQIPLTHNTEIEIALVDGAEGDYLKDYGKLSWKVPVRAGETKKFRFAYSVKAEKGKSVAGI